MAGLTTRTIDKLESGRHTPNEQTFKSLCRGLGVASAAFIRPSPDEEARSMAEFAGSLKKVAVVPTKAIKSPNDFLFVRNGCEAFRFEISAVEGDEAQDIAARLVDYITDLMDIWPDLNFVERLTYAREVIEIGKALGKLGYSCFAGSHRERLPGKKPLTFTVGLLSVLKTSPKENTRYAIINLHGNWEVPEEDRPAFPLTADIQ
jgi:hypothetical protein